MTEKRFYIDNSGDLWDRQSNDILMMDFGDMKAIYVNAILDCMNELNDENQQLRNFIMDLQSVVQFDVDNGVKAYHTKTLLENLNDLKRILND